MKNKKFIALLAMTVALSGVMTACSFGGGKEDSVVVESTPTPTPAKKAKVTPTVAADAQNTTNTSKFDFVEGIKYQILYAHENPT